MSAETKDTDDGDRSAPDPRWEAIHAKVPLAVQRMRAEAQRCVLEEARCAMAFEGRIAWETMATALENGCVGFVWFKSENPTLWTHAEAARFAAMVDRVLPGSSYVLLADTKEFCLLVPPPKSQGDPNGGAALQFRAALEHFGAWVWDPRVATRRLLDATVRA